MATKAEIKVKTRSEIKVKGVNYCKIYKYWDGYPEHMVGWLERFNKQFTEKLGDDPSYKIAQLLRVSVDLEKEFDLDPSRETGWGVVKYEDDTGAKYVYTLERDGKVSWKET